MNVSTQFFFSTDSQLRGLGNGAEPDCGATPSSSATSGATCGAKRGANDAVGSNGRAGGYGNAATDDSGGAPANDDWATHADHDESCG